MEGGWARNARTEGWRTTGAGFFRRRELSSSPLLWSLDSNPRPVAYLLCVTLSKSLNLPKTYIIG